MRQRLGRARFVTELFSKHAGRVTGLSGDDSVQGCNRLEGSVVCDLQCRSASPRGAHQPPEFGCTTPNSAAHRDRQEASASAAACGCIPGVPMAVCQARAEPTGRASPRPRRDSLLFLKCFICKRAIIALHGKKKKNPVKVTVKNTQREGGGKRKQRKQTLQKEMRKKKRRRRKKRGGEL